jgi:hypothetical protein
MKPRRVTEILLAACTTAVLACGQTDPPGDSGTDSGTGDASEPSGFYPLFDGATWTYIHTRSDSSQWSEVVTLTATTYEDQPAFRLQDTADLSGESTMSVLSRAGTTVQRIHKEVFAGQQALMLVDYVPGFPRFDDAWLDLEAGDEETRGYTRTEYDGQGNYPFEDDRSHEYTIVSLSETVTVVAGTFEGCVHVQRQRLFGDLQVKQFWFCEDVGKVKEVNDSTGTIEELKECDVPGGACP